MEGRVGKWRVRLTFEKIQILKAIRLIHDASSVFEDLKPDFGQIQKFRYISIICG